MKMQILTLMNDPKKITRRSFLLSTAAGIGGLALRPWQELLTNSLQASDSEFPQAERLGRVFTYTKAELKARPDIDSRTVGSLYDDTVVPWLREVVGVNPYRYNQRFVETPDGFIWAPLIQPVQNQANEPVKTLLDTSLGQGMWVEVTVPWVNITLENKPASPGFRSRVEEGFPLRLYYSQVLWVDRIKIDDSGRVLYRLNERYGYGDLMWAAAEAFRPLTPEELAPISPDVEDKLVVVNVEEKYQTLSCFEGKTEVFYCRISGGKRYDPDGTPLDHSSTPVGEHTIWRKQVSAHMSGGTTGAGYDLPGIGWTTLFSGDGVAVHSTFWHNNFGGELMSHGCVNARPQDAKWIFRWVNPPVIYDPGDLYSKDTTVLPTHVKVIEG